MNANIENTFTIKKLFYVSALLFSAISIIENTILYNSNTPNGELFFRISAILISILYLTIFLFSYVYISHNYFWHLKSTAMLWTVIYIIYFLSSFNLYKTQGPLPSEVYLLPLGVLSTYYLTNTKKLISLAVIDTLLFIYASVIIILSLKSQMYIVYALNSYHIYFILNLFLIGHILRKHY